MMHVVCPHMGWQCHALALNPNAHLRNTFVLTIRIVLLAVGNVDHASFVIALFVP